jgi:hypothetical protein
MLGFVVSGPKGYQKCAASRWQRMWHANSRVLVVPALGDRLGVVPLLLGMGRLNVAHFEEAKP